MRAEGREGTRKIQQRTAGGGGKKENEGGKGDRDIKKQAETDLGIQALSVSGRNKRQIKKTH